MDHLLPCVLDYVGHPVPQQVLPSLYPRHSLWNNKQSCFIYLTFRDRFIGMQAIVEKREKKNKSKVCLSPPPKKMLRTPLVPYVSQILLLNYFTLFYLNHTLLPELDFNKNVGLCLLCKFSLQTESNHTSDQFWFSISGQIIAHLGDQLKTELMHCLPIFLDRLKNEITRLTAVKALISIAKSDLKIELKPILAESMPILAGFLRKNQRALKMSSLTLLDTVVKNYSTQITDKNLEPVSSIFKVNNQVLTWISQCWASVSMISMTSDDGVKTRNES